MKPPKTYPDGLRTKLAAFARNCVEHGDMTPMAERMLIRILDGER